MFTFKFCLWQITGKLNFAHICRYTKSFITLLKPPVMRSLIGNSVRLY